MRTRFPFTMKCLKYIPPTWIIIWEETQMVLGQTRTPEDLSNDATVMTAIGMRITTGLA